MVWPAYLPLRDAPEDEWVILATTGGWVGQAIWAEDATYPRWRWADSGLYIHPDLTPLGWMPMPPAIDKPVE